MLYYSLRMHRFNGKRFLKIYANGDNWHELDYESGDLGYGWIHYGLIKLLKPKRVLVVGSAYGFIPAVCALACKANKKGMVDFIDAGYDVNSRQDKEKHWGGVGFWKRVDTRKYFGKFGLGNYVNFCLTTSKEFAQKYSKRRWDYIYLDGDHSYQGVKDDYKRFWPKLNPGGYLSLHDIYVDKLGGFKYGVIELWRELNKKGLNCLSFPGKYGLGVIRK